MQADRVLRGGGVVSVQILNKFVSVARRKLKHNWPDIEIALSQFRLSFDAVPPLTLNTHMSAVAFARDHGLSFYDALIVAAAVEAGCDTLYSEDLQHGRNIGGLTIRNPSLGAAQ